VDGEWQVINSQAKKLGEYLKTKNFNNTRKTLFNMKYILIQFHSFLELKLYLKLFYNKKNLIWNINTTGKKLWMNKKLISKNF
jgi:hypothetical protein